LSDGSDKPAAVVTDDERYFVTRRVTLVGSAVDAVLGVLKLTVGWLAQSQALIADGVHSLSDLATDVIVLVAAGKAREKADEEHPYGHERFETLATVVLGLSLIAVAVGLGFDAVRRMLHPELLLHPAPWAIWAAGVSVIAKEAIYHYTIRAARRVRSKLMEANAWHSRSDAVSSLVVIAGLLGTMAGLENVDAVAALVVAWMIGRIGWGFALQSVRELVDTGLDQETLDSIRDAIMTVDGVGALHELRTRRMGSRALVDVHIILADGRVSVSEGHQVSEAVRQRVINRIDDVSDVMVHIDPEDDEISPTRLDLPTRSQLSSRLGVLWAPIDGHELILGLGFHYLGGKVHVEVRVPGTAVAPGGVGPELRARLSKAAEAEADVGRVTLLGVFDDPK
jgi:cation diffusion facilitator family transporter